MFHSNSNRKAGGQVHPVECPVYVGKSRRYLSIFRKDRVTI
jgi:hypothetical protein